MEVLGVTSPFWSGRRVFMTGHTGFKGSWLSLWLDRLGARVTGYALPPPTEPAMFDLVGAAANMDHHIGDVRDLPRLTSALRAAEPEVVFHLAAQPLVRLSYAEPVDTYAINLMGTVNLLEAVRAVPSVRAVVIVTSDKCYENREWLWGYRETEPMGGSDPYSSSKGCAELITTAYRRSFFSDGSGAVVHPAAVASVRAGNVIGGGDWGSDRLVPDTIRAFLAEKDVTIRYPGAIRPWQHVLDPLSGYLRIAELLATEGRKWAEGWNFGPLDGNEQPVRVLVDSLVRLWGGTASWHHDGSAQLHEHHYLRLDCSKARSLMGWSAKLKLEQALAQTVEWFRAFEAGEDLRNLTLRQIAAHEALDV